MEKHPLNYSLNDFETLLNKKLIVKYKTYKNEVEIIEGYLIRITPINLNPQGIIMPFSITLDLGREERGIDIFDIESINLG